MTGALGLFDTSSAELSDCGTYRYELRRWWTTDPTFLGFTMLNPSTADAEVDDPTIVRCCGFARALGYSGIVVKNLFALRATDPRELARHDAPIGPDNNMWLQAQDPAVGMTIAAWGAHGGLGDRDRAVTEIYAAAGVQLHHLGLTKHGAPRHPLYLPVSARPEPYVRPA